MNNVEVEHNEYKYTGAGISARRAGIRPLGYRPVPRSASNARHF